MKEAEELRKYEEELRDQSEFCDWQRKMLENDDNERKIQIEDRRQEMFAAQGAAVKAKQDIVRINPPLHHRGAKAPFVNAPNELMCVSCILGACKAAKRSRAKENC